MKTKVLKIKVGEVFINKEVKPVFLTAWKKTSKDGKTDYYEVRLPLFIKEVETKERKKDNGQTEL